RNKIQPLARGQASDDRISGRERHGVGSMDGCFCGPTARARLDRGSHSGDRESLYSAPASLTSTSSFGQRASTAAATLRTEACEERSARNAATVAPLPAAALMRADAMRVLVLLRPTMARFAPSAASASAAANPMPLVAPVIRICLSLTAQQSNAMATLG